MQRLLEDYAEFAKYRGYPKAKRNSAYDEKVKIFNERMQTGYDVRSTDKDRTAKLTELFGVPMEEEDKELYTDNCKQKTCQCPWDSWVKLSVQEGCL